MKPVIITLNSDGKVTMSVEEFKCHMDAAYNQGYSDGNSATTTITATPYDQRWWYDVTCNSTALNTTETNARDCVTASCVDSTQMSISDYVKSKGE
jgi:hypothetical protein